MSEPIEKLRELVEKIRHVPYNEIFPLVEDLEALLPALEQQLKFWKDAAYRLEETIRLLRTEKEA